LVAAILFGGNFSSCNNFDCPAFLNSFNYFSLFFFVLLFYLFCFDFVSNDKLYLFSQNFQLFFIFFIICVLYCSADFLNSKNIVKYEYDLLCIFVVFSGISLCFCNEFLLVYLLIELQSLSLYVFATFNRHSEYSTEAGLKYFVFGAIMSCFLLIGLSFIYLMFGSVSFEVIYSIANYGTNPVFFIGFFFVLCVLMFKIGCAPFHV
jgi:NADH-quinone oxidoreductase subunit N